MKCDTPVTLPGGLTAGCTLEAPHVGREHEYSPEAEEFKGKVVICPVCSTVVGDTTEAEFDCTTCDTTFVLSADAPPAPDEPEDSDFSGAILMCPLCQSTIDAEKWGPQTVVCPSDGTTFSVVLREEAVLEHSMY